MPPAPAPSVHLACPTLKVFVSRVLPPDGMRLIHNFADKHNVELEVWQEELPPSRNVLLEKVKCCHGIITLLTDTIDGEVMDAAGEQLKVVSNFAVGYNNIDCPAAVKRGIRVGHTPGVLTEATADMAFALLMAASRRVVEAAEYAKAGKWKTWLPLGFIGQDLYKKKVGVVGMGRIGYAFARRCLGWEMEILYYDTERVAIAEEKLGAKFVDFETLLKESDVISVHCLLTPTTTHLFGREEFGKMKKTAIFINAARGPIHDQFALIDACKTRSIFAAGIDVTDPEPPRSRDPVLNVPNLIVVPHIASATTDTRNAMSTICAKNLIAGLTGENFVAEVPETSAPKSKM